MNSGLNSLFTIIVYLDRYKHVYVYVPYLMNFDDWHVILHFVNEL